MRILLGALVTLSLAAGCASTRNSPMTSNAAPALSDATANLGGPRSMSGVVQGFTHAPDGKVDGVYLANGNRVHVPPALGGQLAIVAPVGMNIQVQGREMRDPAGRVTIAADRVTNTVSNGTLDVASAGTPPPNGMGGSGTGQPPPAADPGVPPPPPVNP